MGVGGKFWDLLKPYARNEGFDFLRNKRVAIDLSFWSVQHETALKAYARNPHLTLTFFRTINLFCKCGALLVFVIDGTPSPLKAQARIARFYRSSGIDFLNFPETKDGVSVERNRAFVKCVQECVLFGMPVLKAKGEAEALCAQLDREGHVDACITSDSDAFLFAATCVIKGFRSSSKEPFECYYVSDIEAGFGLKRKQLIAIALLVGNDHDIYGVQGIGLETALCFVQTLGEDEIINMLYGIGNNDTPALQRGTKFLDVLVPSSEESSPKKKLSHCSFCGHPGSKRDYLKNSWEYCFTSSDGGCKKKPEGFKCDCMSCDVGRKEKEQKKQDHWYNKVCARIALEPNFPNSEIIEMYLCNNHCFFTGKDGPCIAWGSPKIELLVDFLAFHQHWEPSYIRQRILPMLSSIFLREMAMHPVKSLLYGQHDFDSIDQVKARHGRKFYVIKWRKAAPRSFGISDTACSEDDDMQQGVIDIDESVDLLDELDAPMIQINDGCQFLLTDEIVELIQAALPQEQDGFLREKPSDYGIKTVNIKPKWMECNVLVVDSDPICLAIVSKMLCLFGYTVSTARKAADALSLARERKSGFQLILTEIHLPDMGRYDFIEKMERFSKSPFVILTSDNDEKAMLGGLVKGAKMYLLKPLQMNNLKYLWQIAYRKFDQGPVESIEYEEPRISYGESLQRNAIVEDLESRVSIKREYGAAGEAEMHANEEEDSEGSTSLIKRPKLIWNDELHNMFLQAINILGVDGAHANEIHQLMNVPGLTKENVSSHLQKYRLTLKREQDAIQEKAMMARPSSGSGDLAPYNNIPPSPPLNLQEGIGTNARRDLPGFGENIQFVKEENFVNEKMDFCNVGNLGFGSAIESPNPMSNFIKQSQQEQQLQQPQVGLEEITGENDINFGAERDGVDELFKTENGSTQVVFRDEDLDDFV